ncbi:hypothetical protein E3P78_02646 [Wallemia ichthyophaga]|nr:hypothetical protein E3P78_02646 [Wallemia ichthyophaga]
MSSAIRLNRIYDFIDAGRFNDAISQCCQLLNSNSTSPRSDLVKSLLAFSYSRSGNAHAARKIALGLASTTPSTADTLAALNLTLSDLGEYDVLAGVYRELWQRNGSAYDKQAKLALTNYVKAFNWRAVQATCLRLSKHDRKYEWWAVAALLMQAVSADVDKEKDTEKGIALALALRIAHSLHPSSAQQAHLLTRLYSHAGDLEKAARVLDECHAYVNTSLALQELQWDVLAELHRTTSIRDKAHSLLRAGSHNYAHHSAYLSTIQCGQREDVDHAIELFHSLSLQDPKERGHLIALMEVSRRCHSDEGAPQLIKLIERYWQQYKSKPVCHDDLAVFLAHLHGQQVDLGGLRGLFSAALHDDDEQLDVRINAAKLSRSLAITTSISEDVDSAAYYARLYAHYQPASAGVPSTDIHPADDLGVLSVLCHVSAYHKSKPTDTAHLHAAVAFIEWALQGNVRSYKLKILYIALCRILAQPGGVWRGASALRIQSVQNDTLSAYACAQISALSCSRDDVAGVLPSTTSPRCVWNQSARESAEMMGRLFEKGAWSHLEDFAAFRDRLASSLNKWLLWFEDVRIRLGEVDRVGTEEMEAWVVSLQQLKTVGVDRLVDNRDSSLLPSHSPLDEPHAGVQLHVLTNQDAAWLSAYCDMYARFLNAALGRQAVQVETGSGNETQTQTQDTDNLTAPERVLSDMSHLAHAYHCQGSDAEKAPVAQRLLDTYTLLGELLNAATLPIEQAHCVKVAIEAWSLILLAIPAPSKKKKTKSPSYPLYNGVGVCLANMVKGWQSSVGSGGGVDHSLFARLHDLVLQKIDYKNM